MLKRIEKNICYFIMFIMLSACATSEDIKKPFNPKDFAEKQESIINDTAELGPQLDNKFSSSEDRRIYIDENMVTDYTKIISKNFAETFPISINFDNVDIRSVMQTFSIITGKNILVGDEVQGLVKARILNEDWDDVLEAILEMKNIALTLSPNTNIVRIHSKEVISAQEEYNRKRKAEVRQAMELSKSIQPVRSEIFKLFYSEPSTVKTQIEDVLSNMDATASAGEDSAGGSSGASDRVKITVDERLRALIVLGVREDLDFIEKLVNEIDIPTKQILIEAFVVTVTDSFEKNLGTRLGMYYGPNETNIASGGLVSAGGTIGGPPTTTTGVNTLGTFGTQSVGTMAENTISSATGSIGMILDASKIDLNLELQAMEADSISKVIANPKIFTLDNQTAKITQGVQIPYTSASSSGTQTQFKDAALTLEVTPSIIGDGNIIMDISVNNDSVTDATASNPPISKTAVNTKLLIANESIVIIGGIFQETSSDSTSKTPGLGDIPVFGSLFKMQGDKDLFNRVFIFIAPKIL
jgi:type IV pilus assembly protein PilQ